MEGVFVEVATVVRSSRETVMSYLWEQGIENFASQDFDRAESFFRYHRCLEEMTDDEYLETCYCDAIECPCHH